MIDLGLGELIAAHVALAIVGPDGAIWSPRPAALRAAAAVVHLQTVAEIARGPQPALTPRAIVVPVEATTPAGTTAAIVAHRPPSAPPLAAREVMLVAALGHQVAPIVHGFLIDHANRTARDAGDEHGLFRAEAVKRARQGGQDGAPVALSAKWLRWAYPTVLGLIVLLFLAAALIDVPSYSTGAAIVQIEGEEITAPSGGTVAAIAVGPGDEVAAGAELVRLHSAEEEADLTRLEAEYRSALAVFLTDTADINARGMLATVTASRDRAQAAVDSRVIRATRAGVVNDIRVRLGELMLPGSHVLSIVDRDAAPTVVALLPGGDRPRLKVGMTLQVELAGYTKVREEAEITFVGAEAVGPASARKYLGESKADALTITGLVVIVRAKLRARTFEANGTTYTFHDGMPGLGEVRIESKSFLRTLIAKD